MIVDDGCNLYINDNLIISHNMAGVAKPGLSWMEVMHKEENAMDDIVASKQVEMVGG